MGTITLSNEVKKAIAKNEYYGEESFINDANQWIKAIKEGRVICTVASVSKSGMSRKLKFLSCEQSNDGRGWYRQYYAMMQVLGFKWNQKDYCITVNGCGMDMIFNTNYTIIHQLQRMGFVTESECSSLAQMTPTNF